MLPKKLFLIAFVLLAFLQEAHGQFLWSVTHNVKEDNGRYTFDFQCLSSYGNNCTVAGILGDSLGLSQFKSKQYHMFWNSIDAGKTWTMQDPKLPSETNALNDPWQRAQRIDSLNIVAVGAAGLVMRSFDAGVTWVKQTVPTKQGLTGVHFSDSLTGIITAYPDSVAGTIFSTTDGGRNWNTVHFNPSFSNPTTYSGNTYLWQSHSYGNGKFRLFKQGLGPMYTTVDNWKTVDSSTLLIDSTKDQWWSTYYFWDCTFSDGDTIIAYGTYSHAGSDCAIIRSVDGGKSWETPLTRYDPFSLSFMTQLNKDTLIATGFSQNHFLLSVDRGKTWALDTILIDTSILSNVFAGIQWVPNGIIAAFGGLGSANYLLHTEIFHSDVKANTQTTNSDTFIYPNPAEREINIISPDALKPVYIFDMLGREVLRGKMSSQGKAAFDVSALPHGVYDIVFNHNGIMLPVGKVAVIGR